MRSQVCLSTPPGRRSLTRLPHEISGTSASMRLSTAAVLNWTPAALDPPIHPMRGSPGESLRISGRFATKSMSERASATSKPGAPMLASPPDSPKPLESHVSTPYPRLSKTLSSPEGDFARVPPQPWVWRTTGTGDAADAPEGNISVATIGVPSFDSTMIGSSMVISSKVCAAPVSTVTSGDASRVQTTTRRAGFIQISQVGGSGPQERFVIGPRIPPGNSVARGAPRLDLEGVVPIEMLASQQGSERRDEIGGGKRDAP